VVHWSRCLEGVGRDQETLEEDSLLEFEVLPHGVRDVGGLDGEWNGHVGLFQDIVDLEVADHTAPGEPLHLHGEALHLLRKVSLVLQHAHKAVLDGIGQLLVLDR